MYCCHVAAQTEQPEGNEIALAYQVDSGAEVHEADIWRNDNPNTFGGALSPETSRSLSALLLSPYVVASPLCVPPSGLSVAALPPYADRGSRYVRLPLVIATFTRDGMTSALMDPQLQALLEAVLFEPLAHSGGACLRTCNLSPCLCASAPDHGRLTPGHSSSEAETARLLDIVPIPASSRSVLGTGTGALMRELLVCPGAIVPPLQHLADQVSVLCTPERYKDGFVPLLLFLLRQLVRLQVRRCYRETA